VGRSRLEIYISILAALAQNGPLKLTHIICKANVNSGYIKEYLNFLIDQELIERRIDEKQNRIYVITKKGLTALKQFKEVEQVFFTSARAKNLTTHTLVVG